MRSRREPKCVCDGALRIRGGDARHCNEDFSFFVCGRYPSKATVFMSREQRDYSSAPTRTPDHNVEKLERAVRDCMTLIHFACVRNVVLAFVHTRTRCFISRHATNSLFAT